MIELFKNFARAVGEPRAREVMSYEIQRADVEDRVDSMPRGTQKRISKDLEMTKGQVSQIVRGLVHNKARLQQIEEWLPK